MSTADPNRRGPVPHQKSEAYARRIFMLQFGAEPVAKSLSLKNGSPTQVLYEPIVGILVDTDDGWVLLETGIGRQALDDEPAMVAMYQGAVGEKRPWGLEGEPLVTALAEAGLAISDLTLAAVSHLHADHSGGLPLLAAARIPVVIHRRELDFVERQRPGVDLGYYTPDYVNRSIDWRVVGEDTQIAPGVFLLETPGHAPGHCSYRVDLHETGTWLFAIDAADLGENVLDVVPPGTTAIPSDTKRAEESLRRLIEEADSLDARLVPGHDPLIWRAVRHPPGGHR